MKKKLFLLLILISSAISSWGATYKFDKDTEFSTWTSSYETRTLSFNDFDAIFESANKQASTITNMPVTKGSSVTIKAKNGKNIKKIGFTLKQWTSKTQKVTLYCNGAAICNSTNFKIPLTELPDPYDCAYIGFSNKNQVGIESVEIEFEGEESKPSIDVPTFTPAAGTYLDKQYVTISNSEGSTIHYTIDGSDPTEKSATYSTPIEIATTTTVKAIAVNGESVSSIASATYTIIGKVQNIAELLTKPDGETWIFANPVTVAYEHGKYIFLQDETGGIQLYNSAKEFGTKYAQGTILPSNVGISGKLNTFNKNRQFIEVSNLPSASGLEIKSIAPVEIACTEAKDHLNEYVLLKNLEFNGKNQSEVTDAEGNKITLFNSLGATLPKAGTYNIKGFIITYGDKTEILPIEFSTESTPVSITTNPLDGLYENMDKECRLDLPMTVQYADDDYMYIRSNNGICSNLSTNPHPVGTEGYQWYDDKEVNFDQSDWLKVKPVTGATVGSTYQGIVVKYNEDTELEVVGDMPEATTSVEHNLNKYLAKNFTGCSNHAIYTLAPQDNEYAEVTGVLTDADDSGCFLTDHNANDEVMVYTPSDFTQYCDGNYHTFKTLISKNGKNDYELTAVSTPEIATGVEGVDSKQSIEVIGRNGAIEVKANGEVKVYTINGVIVKDETVASSATIEIKAGVYIVTIDGKATKVCVK